MRISVVAASSRLALACAIVLASSTPAAAQPSTSAAATVQFERGRELMKEGKYADACGAFSQSQKLDPQNGTLYNLAGCYAKLGKLATAWAAYHELAKSDSNVKRRADSAKREQELESRLSKLVIEAEAVDGLVVTMDGVDVTGLVNMTTPVDLGSYKITASAPGHEDVRVTARVDDEARTVTINLDLRKPGERPREKQRTREVEPVAGSNRRTYALVSLGAGTALFATSLIFGRLAGSKWDEAKAVCGDDLQCEDPIELMRGNELAATAQSRANVATGLAIGGGIAVAVGAVLYLTAPSKQSGRSALRVSPGSGAALAGVTIGGQF